MTFLNKNQNDNYSIEDAKTSLHASLACSSHVSSYVTNTISSHSSSLPSFSDNGFSLNYFKSNMLAEEEQEIFSTRMYQGFILARKHRNYRAMEIYSEYYYDLNNEEERKNRQTETENKEEEKKKRLKENSLLILCESLLVNRKFQKLLVILQKNENEHFLQNSPYLIIIKAKALLSVGGESIRFCLNFLQRLKPFYIDKITPEFFPLKYLLGRVYEMRDQNHEAMDVYKRLCKENPSINALAIKKVFSYAVLHPSEELEFFREMTFLKGEKWAMHFAIGFICASRRMTVEKVLNRPLKVKKKTESINLHSDFLLYKNVTNVTLFHTKIASFTARDVCKMIENCYPTFALPKVLRFSSLNLTIITKKKFYEKDYVAAYCISKILAEATITESYDVLPFYLMCCVQLGLSLDILSICQRLRESPQNEHFIFFADGCYFLMTGEYEKAIKSFRCATDGCQEAYSDIYAASQMCLAFSLSLSNANDQAIRAYQAAARVFKCCYEVYLFLGMEYTKIGCYGDAAKNLLFAKELAVDMPQVYHEFGILALHMKDYRKATSYFKKAVGLSRKNKNLYACDVYECMLGKSYLLCITNEQLTEEEFQYSLQEAFVVLAEGEALNPMNADICAYLACCYYISGQSHIAVDYITKAMTICKTNNAYTSLLKMVFESTNSFFSSNKYHSSLEHLSYCSKTKIPPLTPLSYLCDSPMPTSSCLSSAKYNKAFHSQFVSSQQTTMDFFNKHFKPIDLYSLILNKQTVDGLLRDVRNAQTSDSIYI